MKYTNKSNIKNLLQFLREYEEHHEEFNDDLEDDNFDESGIKKFEDLTKEEQERAIEENSDILVDDKWYSWIVEDFQKELEEFGISDVEVNFSGFYSQGDGASFTSSNIDTDIFLTKALKIESNEFIILSDESIINNDPLVDLMNDLRELGFKYEKVDSSNVYINFTRRYFRHVHENSVEVDLESDGHPDDWGNETENDFKFYLEELEEKIDTWRVEKCKKLYDSLEKEYESLRSEDNIRNELIDGEYDINPETGEIT